MSLDQSRDRVSLETPRQSVENTMGMDGAGEQRPTGIGGVSPNVPDSALHERVDNVLQSDIGVSTMLNRLKQSIASVKDFSTFLRERSSLEEKHASGLKKLSQGTAELIRKPDSRQGSFAQNYFEVTRIHDRMADHGQAYAIELHNMSDELQDLASNMERGRKHWKQSGLNAEKRVQDSEQAMDKAKSKYDSLAEQYDRARTGEKSGGKFGLKGGKSEDELLRKVQAADSDYAQKVHSAQGQRNELLSLLRPQAVKALYDLISESDAGLSAHMHKFAAVNERLLLSNGLCVNPLTSETNGGGPQPRSLREVAKNVNNEKDFQEYVLSFSNKAGTKPSEIKYEKHPALASPKQTQQPPFQSQQNFNNQQPQYGQPTQSNVGLGVGGFGDGPPRGQMSGVTQTPYQNRDGQQGPGSYNQYDQRPGMQQQPSSQYSGAPQLPPMDLPASTGGLGNRSDMLSPTGPTNDYRSTSSPLNQNRPPGQMGGQMGSPNNEYRPANGPLNQNRSASQPGFGGQNNYPPSNQPGQGNFTSNPPPRTDSFGSGGLPANANTGMRQADMGPTGGAGGAGGLPSSVRPNDGQGQYNRGPQMGQSGNPGADQRSPQQSNNMRPGEMALAGGALGAVGAVAANSMRSNDGPTGQNNRAPQIGQSGGLGQDQKVSPTFANNNYQNDGRGPPGPQSGSFSSDPRAKQGAPGGTYGGMSPQDNRGQAPPGQNDNYQAQRQNTLPQHTGPSNSIGSFSNAPPSTAQPRRSDMHRPNLPPLNPVFGVSLDELFRRDGSAVPTIVYQCIQAVDLFGLDTEGVYRTSGSAPHIMEMKAMFDNDSTQVDFRSPAAFHNDIASVTTLLKHFLRDLPDPLLTSAQYNSFIQAAKLDDDIIRRDSLHAIINSLPDPNYATLRVLTLHLNRVADHSERNRMTPSNIAICFGPTLMGGGGSPGSAGGGDIRDAGWQARVVETILANTMQIFDDDE